MVGTSWIIENLPAFVGVIVAVICGCSLLGNCKLIGQKRELAQRQQTVEAENELLTAKNHDLAERNQAVDAENQALRAKLKETKARHRLNIAKVRRCETAMAEMLRDVDQIGGVNQPQEEENQQ